MNYGVRSKHIANGISLASRAVSASCSPVTSHVSWPSGALVVTLTLKKEGAHIYVCATLCSSQFNLSSIQEMMLFSTFISSLLKANKVTSSVVPRFALFMLTSAEPSSLKRIACLNFALKPSDVKC
jgi:hypothetical protein